jgi:uncharacterized membrane protein YjjP (DUF1212 family)
MAKLEEISELLVSEIRDFEEAVKRLEKIREAKITLDLTELKSVLSNHEMVLKHQNSNVQETYNKFANLMKEAKIYPKWAVILFIASLVLNCIIILYLLKGG